MEIGKFMRAIGLSARAIAAVKQANVPLNEALGLPGMPLSDGRYEGDRPDRILALFVGYLAARSEADYLVRGVTREEWLDTMRDLAIWSDFLFAERGEVGIRETHWLFHLVRTEIYRLGRLQFVPCRSEREVSFGNNVFPAGTRYCQVHIPAGERLFPSAADASFRRAAELFSPAFYACESWILSPKLGEFLQEGNLVSFAARFERTKTDLSDRSAERYIFGRIGDPRTYLPRNAFAEKVKAAALRGEAFGSALGYGIF